MTSLGSITLEDGTYTLRFERVLPVPPAEVWAALTQPSRLAAWLAPAEVVPGPTGEITIDFGDGGTETGSITEWDPPHVLAYEWNFVGHEPSFVRWELALADEGRATRLTLEHSRLESSAGSGYGTGYAAGWHAYLDGLEGHLAGTVPDWEKRFEELLPRYREIATAKA